MRGLFVVGWFLFVVLQIYLVVGHPFIYLPPSPFCCLVFVAALQIYMVLGQPIIFLSFFCTVRGPSHVCCFGLDSGFIVSLPDLYVSMLTLHTLGLCRGLTALVPGEVYHQWTLTPDTRIHIIETVGERPIVYGVRPLVTSRMCTI